jgi:hypothetical protein
VHGLGSQVLTAAGYQGDARAVGGGEGVEVHCRRTQTLVLMLA